MEELDGWTCCGASHVQDIAPEITLATNARNIALAEEKGLNLLTVCNTCTLMLREAKNELDANEKEKNEVNKKLAQIGKQYRGTTDITHFLWVLIRDYGLDKLKAKVVKPLTGLRVAEYYVAIFFALKLNWLRRLSNAYIFSRFDLCYRCYTNRLLP